MNWVFLQIFVVNVKWMTMKDIKQGESWKVENKALMEFVNTRHKWKMQIKPN